MPPLGYYAAYGGADQHRCRSFRRSGDSAGARRIIGWSILPVAYASRLGAILMMLRERTCAARLDRHSRSGAAGADRNAALLYKVAAADRSPWSWVAGCRPSASAFSVDLFGAIIGADLAAVRGAGGEPLRARRDYDRRPALRLLPFLMLLLAGVSGAFLTGDIFNLYRLVRSAADFLLRPADPRLRA